MKILILLFVILLQSNCAAKNDIQSFLDSADKANEVNAIECRNGKTDQFMMNISSVSIKSKEDLFEMVGKPDTVVKEIVILECLSHIYVCQNRFISFHFNDEGAFVGRSWGGIENGEYKIDGSGIIIEGEKSECELQVDSMLRSEE